MSKKREEKIQMILHEAVKVWGRLPSQERSLTPLAEACGMTKQALYRYFPNKQAIIDGLSMQMDQHMLEYREEMLGLAASIPGSFSQIVSLTAQFLDRFWEHLNLAHQENTMNDVRCIQSTVEFHQELEKKSSIPMSHWFWFLHCLISVLWNGREKKNGKAFTNAFLKNIEKKVTHGFANGVISLGSSRKKIESNPLGEIESHDISGRIASAVLDLIDEKGVAQLSLKELADQAGMGKSSLYNYYSSKEELLVSTMREIQQIFRTKRDAFLGSLENSTQRIYGHILFLSRFVHKIPAIKVLITELRNQMEFYSSDEWQRKNLAHLGEIFRTAVKEGILTSDLLKGDDQMQLISFAMGMELFYFQEEESPEDRAFRIYRLYTQGISLEK